MSKRISRQEARERAEAVLDTPRTEPISVDWCPGTREELIRRILLNGRNGAYGEFFEDLTDPTAVNVPGVQQRTDHAILNAVTQLGIAVVPDYDFGDIPRFNVGNTIHRGEIYAVVLALVAAYPVGTLPTELAYASERVIGSGTHATGVAHRVSRELHKMNRRAHRAVSTQ